jgi:RNA polymerase sigma factor (sigma-70 family)
MPNLSNAQLAALVQRAQKGDSDAFTILYTATVEQQLYFAATFLKDAGLAKDVTQEVYLAIYENIGKLENPKLFAAYLKRTTYNTCVDFRRKYKRRLEELDNEEMELQEDTAVAHNPDEYYLELESRSELQQALSALPEVLRAVFLFRFYNEMKISEIADIMELSDRTVNRYIKAAVAQLKEDKNLSRRYQAQKTATKIRLMLCFLIH